MEKEMSIKAALARARREVVMRGCAEKYTVNTWTPDRNAWCISYSMDYWQARDAVLSGRAERALSLMGYDSERYMYAIENKFTGSLAARVTAAIETIR